MKRILGLGAMALAVVGLVSGCSGAAGKDGTNGLDGKLTLVRIDTEAEGANCAAGGTAIKVGVDANSNGKLEDGEVSASQTRYVCNGVAGNDGNNAPKALVVTTPEPKGTNCQYGGFLIQSGVDDNKNNTLDAGEVDSSQYVCESTSLDTIYFGNFVASKADKLQELANIEVIIGDLAVNANEVKELKLPKLKAVLGDLYVGYFEEGQEPSANSLTTVELGALQRVTDEVSFYSPTLESLSLPLLEESGDFSLSASLLTEVTLPVLKVAQSVRASYNPELTALNLPVLQQIYYQLYVSENPKLTTVNVPELTSAYEVNLNQVDSTILSLPKLETVQNFYVDDWSSYSEILLPKLKRWPGNELYFGSETLTTLDLSSLEYAEELTIDGTAVTTLSLPALKSVDGDIRVYNNANLTSVSLSALESLDDLRIGDNAALATLDVSSLVSVDEFDIGVTALTVLSASKLETISEINVHEDTIENVVEISFPKIKALPFDSLYFNWPALTKIDFSSLEEVPNNIEIYGTSLTTISLPALKTVWNNVYIYENPNLTTIQFPALELIDSEVDIYDNPLLATVEMPALTDAHGWFTNNPELSVCAIAALNSAIVSRGGSVGIWDDGDNKDETCSNDVYCPLVTVNGVTDHYRFCWYNSETFADARSICQSFGGTSDLAVLDDAAEYSALKTAVAANTFRGNPVWIGYSDADVEGTWAWVNGAAGYTPGVGEFWGAGEPGGGASENCGLINELGQGGDVPCTYEYTFICEVAP